MNESQAPHLARANTEVALSAGLREWDGKSVEDIHSLYQRFKQDPQLIDHLIAFAKQETLQSGATWMLKAHLESIFDTRTTTSHDGLALTQRQANQIIALSDRLHPWQAKLHLLQILPCLTISKANKPKLEYFLRQCLADSNKFVRAWAYNGLFILSQQYPEYREETKQFFAMAMKDEAASVKARIRKLTFD